MPIILLGIIVLLVLAAGVMIIRKDIKHEHHKLTNLRLLAKREKKLEGTIQQRRYLLSPFSRTPCTACYTKVQLCCQKTLIDSKGVSSNTWDWETIFEGHKVEFFRLKVGEAEKIFFISRTKVAAPVTKVLIYENAHQQAKRDISVHLNRWQRGNPYPPRFLSKLKIMPLSQFETMTDLSSSNLYLFEHMIFDQDPVTAIIKPRHHKEHGPSHHKTTDTKPASPPKPLLKTLIKT